MIITISGRNEIVKHHRVPKPTFRKYLKNMIATADEEVEKL